MECRTIDKRSWLQKGISSIEIRYHSATKKALQQVGGRASITCPNIGKNLALKSNSCKATSAVAIRRHCNMWEG